MMKWMKLIVIKKIMFWIIIDNTYALLLLMTAHLL